MNSKAHETLAGQNIEVVTIEWKKPLVVAGDEGWCTIWYKTVMKVKRGMSITVCRKGNRSVIVLWRRFSESPNPQHAVSLSAFLGHFFDRISTLLDRLQFTNTVLFIKNELHLKSIEKLLRTTWINDFRSLHERTLPESNTPPTNGHCPTRTVLQSPSHGKLNCAR